MKAIIIAAVVIVLLAVGIAGAIAAIYTAGVYMQVFYEDDRHVIESYDELRARWRWWRYKTPHKHCRQCCIFCDYTQACMIDVSDQEAEQQLQEDYERLKAKEESGQQLTEREKEIYTELKDWERRRADNEKL